MRLPVRAQLSLPFTILLLALVWLRYDADRALLAELEALQRDQLLASLDRVAPMLVAHPLLLDSAESRTFDAHRDLYATYHPGPFVIDGLADDWEGVPTLRFGSEQLTGRNEAWQPGSLAVELAMTANEAYLHLFLDVTDDVVLYRDLRSLSTQRNDHIRITLSDPEERSRHYVIAERGPGDVTAHVLSGTSRALRREPELSGLWRETPRGYAVELRIHMELIGTRFAFEVWDVDNPETRDLRFAVGSGPTGGAANGGRLTRRHAALDELLGAQRFDRMKLIDDHGRTLAAAGSITGDETRLEASVRVARSGRDFATLTVQDAPTRINAARSRALGRLWAELAVVCLVGIGLWYLIATGMQQRLNTLTRRIRAAVDGRGRVSPIPPDATLNDEVSDIALALHDAEERIARYQHHHEGAMRQLAHELRTPISVVRSSLEAMRMGGDVDPKVYVERASSGLDRLSTLLNKLTEARRLEQSLEAGDVEIFDLAAVLRGCVAGYRSAWPDTTFELTGTGEAFSVTGVPEVLAQLLDKLVANAVSFHESGTPIRITLDRIDTTEPGVRLTISNSGPLLETEQQAALFDPMVSTRSGEGDHLGLGLYIARIIAEYHGGSISLANRADSSGVDAIVGLPGVRLTSRLLR
ncbi:MAG: hypothetical protein CMQ24_04170 [Gammaproteobacteria bacterium]|nr:hypothetical protein [Gammaproteobacteria bacterium]